MKKMTIVLIAIAALLACSQTIATTLTLNNTPAYVFFSPDGGCTDAIIKEIDNAKTDIYVQAYSFTSAPIAKALLSAFKRGVKVEAILDKSQRTAKYSSATFLANVRIPTFIDDKHAIAHNKIMVIDGVTVITGSFNFTKAAEERNAENLLIIRSKDLARLYMDNWAKHREHSEPYQPRY
jgi:phosphatidylserine/phosphatidylglycerophosphate/cardiolipin synthase-like enzyme